MRRRTTEVKAKRDRQGRTRSGAPQEIGSNNSQKNLCKPRAIKYLQTCIAEHKELSMRLADPSNARSWLRFANLAASRRSHDARRIFSPNRAVEIRPIAYMSTDYRHASPNTKKSSCVMTTRQLVRNWLRFHKRSPVPVPQPPVPKLLESKL